MEGSAIKFSRYLRTSCAHRYWPFLVAAVHLALSFDQMELDLEQSICFIRIGQCYVRVQVSKHMVQPSSHHSVCYSHANFCTSIFPISHSIAISLTDFLCWPSGMLVFMLTFFHANFLSTSFQSIAISSFPSPTFCVGYTVCYSHANFDSPFPFNCRIAFSLISSLCYLMLRYSHTNFCALASF
jgi:hypothetical protein